MGVVHRAASHLKELLDLGCANQVLTLLCEESVRRIRRDGHVLKTQINPPLCISIALVHVR